MDPSSQHIPPRIQSQSNHPPPLHNHPPSQMNIWPQQQQQHPLAGVNHSYPASGHYPPPYPSHPLSHSRNPSSSYSPNSLTPVPQHNTGHSTSSSHSFNHHQQQHPSIPVSGSTMYTQPQPVYYQQYPNHSYQIGPQTPQLPTSHAYYGPPPIQPMQHPTSSWVGPNLHPPPQQSYPSQPQSQPQHPHQHQHQHRYQHHHQSHLPPNQVPVHSTGSSIPVQTHTTGGYTIPTQHTSNATYVNPPRHSSEPPSNSQLQPQLQPQQPQSKSSRIDTSLPLEQLREQVRQSMDSLAHLDFIKHLVSIADDLVRSQRESPIAIKNVQLLYNEALKWAKRLASQGPGGINASAKTSPCAEAQMYLAECYGNGLLGLPVEHEKAFSYYHQAAKLGHPEATYRVAVCHEMGAGTKRDPQKAVSYYKKAAIMGDPAALYKIGVIQLYGDLGYGASPREGLVMLKRAAAAATANHPHALHELAMLHEPGDDAQRGPRDIDPRVLRELTNLVMPDAAYALELYTRAATLGYAPSQFRLGVCFQDGELTCPTNPKASISWFTKAAEQGHPDAELALSGWYLEGAPGLLEPDDGQAFAWARRAADKGATKGEYAIGYYYEVGIGVQPNIDEARRWYQRAAAQGSRRAMERLSELNSYTSKTKNNPQRPDVKRDKSDDCLIM